MKKNIDKTVKFAIEKVFPFIIVGLGVGLGIIFGSMFNIGNPQDPIYPKVIGGTIGFIMFGIIGRSAWLESNEETEPTKERKR